MEIIPILQNKHDMSRGFSRGEAPAPLPARAGWLPLVLAAGLLCLLLAACGRGPLLAQEAYKALKRVEVKTTIKVVPYEDFVAELGEARVAVNAFLASAEAREEPRLREALQDALFAYELSGKLWHILRQVGMSSVAGNIRRVCVRRASAAGQELTAYLASLGALPPPQSDGCPYEEIDITRQMTFLWERASQQLRQANGILKY